MPLPPLVSLLLISSSLLTLSHGLNINGLPHPNLAQLVESVREEIISLKHDVQMQGDDPEVTAETSPSESSGSPSGSPLQTEVEELRKSIASMRQSITIILDTQSRISRQLAFHQKALEHIANHSSRRLSTLQSNETQVGVDHSHSHAHQHHHHDQHDHHEHATGDATAEHPHGDPHAHNHGGDENDLEGHEHRVHHHTNHDEDQNGTAAVTDHHDHIHTHEEHLQAHGEHGEHSANETDHAGEHVHEHGTDASHDHSGHPDISGTGGHDHDHHHHLHIHRHLNHTHHHHVIHYHKPGDGEHSAETARAADGTPAGNDLSPEETSPPSTDTLMSHQPYSKAKKEDTMMNELEFLEWFRTHAAQFRPTSEPSESWISERKIHRPHHHHTHSGHAHSHGHEDANRERVNESNLKEMEASLHDGNDLTFATCEIRPNRHISLVLQQDVHGRINMWQRRDGSGPVHMHVLLRGFRQDNDHDTQESSTETAARSKRHSIMFPLSMPLNDQPPEDMDGHRHRHSHGFHVHALGNLSRDCQSAGLHYNPLNAQHGGPLDEEHHIGDLGNIECNSRGETDVEVTYSHVSFFGEHSILGRSLVIHANPDDLGRGNTGASMTSGNSGPRIACCQIVSVDELPKEYDSPSQIMPLPQPSPQSTVSNQEEASNVAEDEQQVVAFIRRRQ